MNNYRDVLNEKGFLVTSIVGNSMMPLLREDKDTVLIKPKTRVLKKYDVVLFQRENKKYVLHRIIKIKNNNLIICGDNRIHKDYDIHSEDIIGIMEGYYKKEKFISINSFWYKVYCHLLWLNRIFVLIKFIVMKIFRKRGNQNE